MGVRNCHPRENFEISDAIWCNLVHFGKKLTVLQFSTFVNENIAIMLDSGIDIVVLLQRGSKFVSGENSTLTGCLDKPLLLYCYTLGK